MINGEQNFSWSSRLTSAPISRSMGIMCDCPCKMATCNGVAPDASEVVRSLTPKRFRVMRTRTTSDKPFSTATYIDVRPDLDGARTSAPASMMVKADAMLKPMMDMVSGLYPPSSSTMFTSAPMLMSCDTTWAWR